MMIPRDFVAFKELLLGTMIHSDNLTHLRHHVVGCDEAGPDDTFTSLGFTEPDLGELMIVLDDIIDHTHFTLGNCASISTSLSLQELCRIMRQLRLRELRYVRQMRARQAAEDLKRRENETA